MPQGFDVVASASLDQASVVLSEGDIDRWIEFDNGVPRSKWDAVKNDFHFPLVGLQARVEWQLEPNGLVLRNTVDGSIKPWKPFSQMTFVEEQAFSAAAYGVVPRAAPVWSGSGLVTSPLADAAMVADVAAIQVEAARAAQLVHEASVNSSLSPLVVSGATFGPAAIGGLLLSPGEKLLNVVGGWVAARELAASSSGVGGVVGSLVRVALVLGGVYYLFFKGR